MSESEGSHHHPGVRGIVERIAEHHEQAVQRREEEALSEAAENAAFDLATDIAHSTPGHDPVGYDVETDLGFDEEPPELRP
ncbi:hypothetical protein [Streptomyces brasiliensis]|uniref:Uncharacterized protein n=1 Tax=Streptomyces brasiliensis TaxID=1954 RepID=A0A917NE54_9ACTN|nr:hypothetical protein [Streptomyces brasiliensis]GGI94211.1 hypothetical protein GCM10010121_000710 [Streptomyces brasiliensis]